jgi:uncharacterized protein YndB with AHSA1/START domain
MPGQNYKNASYTTQTVLSKPIDEVFKRLIDLSHWWPEDFIGEEIKPGSEFVLKTGEGHFSKSKILEFVPPKRLVWITTESIRKADNFDWTGTKFIFELTPAGSGTILEFTYDGTVFENEESRLIQICDTCIQGMFYDFVEGYHTKIEIPKSAAEVFQCITEGVPKWWGGRDYSGCSIHLNDEFIVNHPGTHYSKQRLVEVIQDRKVVWLVEDSRLNWLKHQDEWTNTRMIFEITPNENSSILQFTHEGLVPEKECFARCSEGWSQVIRNWLVDFVVTGKPHFEL